MGALWLGKCDQIPHSKIVSQLWEAGFEIVICHPAQCEQSRSFEFFLHATIGTASRQEAPASEAEALADVSSQDSAPFLVEAAVYLSRPPFKSDLT